LNVRFNDPLAKTFGVLRFNSPLDELTYSLPLISALRLDPIYVARIPAAPFAVADDSTNHMAAARHESERVFYPDTNDVSSTSKGVALSIARDRTRELILSASRFLVTP